MKRIFTLLTVLLLFITGRSQVVLNELYAIPGAGKHEFFELYNNGSSFAPISLQGYTIVTYFEEPAGVQGLYVMDLPDLMVQPKGYFVGSAAIPFNYQGITGSTQSHFSWNDLTFMALNNGYLKKWVVGNNVPVDIDGNSFYDEQVLPADFNDFFYRRTGGGAGYSVFVYKHGVLVNAFFGGASANVVPAFILGLPDFKVAMAGGGGVYTIPFSTYANISAEFVIAEAGSDNGYTRLRDGLCGEWQKSSSGVQHTPNAANGSESGTTGTILLSAMISRGASPTDSSIVLYKLIDAPPGVFPVIIDVYVDNGLVATDLDAADTYVASKTILNLSNTLYETKFLPYDANVLLAVKTAAGCFDMVMLVSSRNVLLPLKLQTFTGSIVNGVADLKWSVTENGTGTTFDVQQSHNGIDFTTIGQVVSSDKQGNENYSFKGTDRNNPGGFYRLKINNYNHAVSYSKVIDLTGKAGLTNSGIVLRNNPVESYLGFTFNSATGNSVDISIYSMTGSKLYTTQSKVQKGINSITLNMGGHITTGTYVLEVKNNTERAVIKMIKK
ncbi:MAG TPA: T9SS type A sorting domain-containing protein [Chitinophagaceae bacterium]